MTGGTILNSDSCSRLLSKQQSLFCFWWSSKHKTVIKTGVKCTGFTYSKEDWSIDNSKSTNYLENSILISSIFLFGYGAADEVPEAVRGEAVNIQALITVKVDSNLGF